MSKRKPQHAKSSQGTKALTGAARSATAVALTVALGSSALVAPAAAPPSPAA